MNANRAPRLTTLSRIRDAHRALVLLLKKLRDSDSPSLFMQVDKMRAVLAAEITARTTGLEDKL